MGTELVKIDITIPEIPTEWDYDKSIKKVKQFIYKWKNLTYEIAVEIYIAREKLSVPYRPKLSGAFAPLTWDSYCIEIGSCRSTVNRWLARWFLKELPEPKNKPKGKYSVIYADPPWKYEFSKDSADKIEQHYPTMTIDEIKQYPIKSYKNAVIYLWATCPKLLEALGVLECWGFTYRTNLAWDKEWIGMGYWFRGQHELLLVGTKGNAPPPLEQNRISSVFRAKRTKHSKKPDKIREYIELWHPEAKKIELFAREAYPNWETIGNEI